MKGHNIVKWTRVSTAAVYEHIVFDNPTSMTLPPSREVPKGFQFRPGPGFYIELMGIIINVVRPKAALYSAKNEQGVLVRHTAMPIAFLWWVGLVHLLEPVVS